MTKKAGSFSAYLEYAQRGRRETLQSQTPSTGPLAILKVLAGIEAGIPLAELATRAAMAASAFQEALKKLNESNFIAIAGSPLEEIVQLTPKGRDMVNML